MTAFERNCSNVHQAVRTEEQLTSNFFSFRKAIESEEIKIGKAETELKHRVIILNRGNMFAFQ